MKNTEEKLSLIQKLNIIAIFMPIMGLTVFNGIFFIGIIFGLQTAVFLLNLKFNKGKLDKLEKKILALFIVAFILTLIIDVCGKYFRYTIWTTFLIWGSIILTLLLIITDKNRILTIKKTFKLISITTLILVIYAIVLKTFGGAPILLEKNNDILFYRQYLDVFGIRLYQNACGDAEIGYAVASLTGNPNTLTGLIVISLIINLTQLNKKANNKFEFKKMIFEIFILIYGLYLAHSRMALILLASIIPLYLILKPRKEKTKKAQNVLMLFILIFLCAILFINIYPNFLSSFDLNGRNIMWNVAFDKMKENIFQLNGLGSSGQIIAEMTGISLSMHNAYLSFILECGIIIFIIFIALNIKLIYKSILYVTQKNSKEGNNYIMIFLVYINLLINGLSEGTFMVYSMYNYLFFYCIFNMIFLLDMKGTERNDNDIYPNI